MQKTQGKSFYVTDLKFLLIKPHECEGGSGRESFSLNAGELYTYIQMYLLCGTCCYVSCDNVCFVFVCTHVQVCEGRQSALSIHHTHTNIRTYLLYVSFCLPIAKIRLKFALKLSPFQLSISVARSFLINRVEFHIKALIANT